MMGGRRGNDDDDDDDDDDDVPGVARNESARVKSASMRKREADELELWYRAEEAAKARGASSSRGAKARDSSPLPGIQRQNTIGTTAEGLITAKRSCGECGLWLSGDVVAALDQVYHSSCFKCGDCRKPISEFFEQNNKAVCASCFEKAHPQLKCASCRLLLEGPYLRVGTRCYHKACFTCQSCQKLLASGKYVPIDMQPYCESCAVKGVKSK